MSILYFAYGSNMCTERLKERVGPVEPKGTAELTKYCFQFHKESKDDGSAKADAFYTGCQEHVVYGALFQLDESRKRCLDKAEGGYNCDSIEVEDKDGNPVRALIYLAKKERIIKEENKKKPYFWYKRLVVEGAKQHGLPADYVGAINNMPGKRDPNESRCEKNWKVKC